jgi:hypothetical protein
MAIPSGGLINKYDLLDPACYVHPGPINDLVGTVDLSTNGFPTYDATFGALTWNGMGVGAYSAAGSYANITSTFTFSIWFKLNDVSATQLLLNNGDRSGGMNGWSNFVAPTTGQLDFGANNVWGGVFSCPNLDPTKWYNATYSYENVAGGTLKLYINGVLISNTTGVGGPANAYGPNSFLAWGGSGVPGFGSPQYPNKTSYGVVLYYNTVLTGPEVLDIYSTYVDRFYPPVHAYDAADPASYPGSGSTLTDIGSATPINLSLANATFNNVNDSFTLDGTFSSYIRSANSLAGFNIGANNFSIQMWFKYNAATAQPPYNIFLQIGSRTNPAYNGFVFEIVSGQLSIGNTGVANYATGFNPVIGTWYQLTMTVNSSNLVTLYVNGTSVYTQTIAFATPTNILAMGYNGIEGDQVADASVGPLLIHNRVLSGTEITNYYNSTRSRFRVIVEYDFQNGSYSGTGNTVYDLLSPQSNLTVGTGHWVAGTPNYWDLQGDTNLFSDNLAVAFESTTFTINCWYYPDYTSPEQYTAVWSFGNFANPALPVLSVNNTGSINIQWNFGYGIVVTTVTNEWHLFTFVSNGTTTTLYVDGIFIGSNSSSSGYIGTPVVIRLGSASRGASPPAEFAEGKIGFWNYYDIALNSTEVLALYNETESSYVGPPPPPPPYAGLVGGRTFGQGFAG